MKSKSLISAICLNTAKVSIMNLKEVGTEGQTFFSIVYVLCIAQCEDTVMLFWDHDKNGFREYFCV